VVRRPRIDTAVCLRFGMSYTRFDYRDVKVSGGKTLTATFEVRNTGAVKGADVPQVYLTAAAGERVLRLIGFQRVELNPGESRIITVTADPRLLGYFDEERRQWRSNPDLSTSSWRSAADLALGGEAGLHGI